MWRETPVNLSPKHDRMVRELARLLRDYTDGASGYRRSCPTGAHNPGRTPSRLAIGGAAKALAHQLREEGVDLAGVLLPYLNR